MSSVGGAGSVVGSTRRARHGTDGTQTGNNRARAGSDGGRLAALDGLRAVAVLGVMAFHFGSTWLDGGFFGVDIFYVLSGFLITGLLLDEWGRSGRIRLAQFWGRRARRLLPALGLVLVAVTWYVHSVAPPGSYPGYRMDALSTLFYYSNWHQIATSTNYFVATGLVSPLTHCWSLAIEEQFYLVWPLVLLVVLAAARNLVRATRLTLVLCVAGALASAAWMAVLFSNGASTTRLYFGTDTHAQCILVGSGLACWLRLRQHRRRASVSPEAVATGAGPGAVGAGARETGRRAGWAIDAASLCGLAGIALAAHRLTGDSPLTYQGGFLLVAVASAAVILAAVTVPDGITARALALAPLPWLGRISYGMYLWHFPLFIYLSPARTGLSGAPLAVARVGTTIGISALSFYAVERPVLERRFWRTARALVPAGAGAVVVTGVIVAATLGSGVSQASAVHYRPRPASAAAAAGTHVPPRVVVLGDSTALTLYYALKATAPAGTQVTTGALFGCGLIIGSGISADPPHMGLVLPPACNAATPTDQQWPADDRQAVAGTSPGDVVLFLGGQNDSQQTLLHGRWTGILSRSFQQAERSSLRTLTSISTAHGAHLDLLTMLCADNNFEYGGIAPSSTGTARRAIFDGLLDGAAAARPGWVSVIDYASMFCPHNRFAEFVGGVQVRAGDGVHTPAYVPNNPYAGNSSASVAGRFYSWLADRLWPKILAAPGPTSPTVAPR
ncbi:MAG: acyltransferase family protein [Acidimicrobiales bacterium]